MRDTITPSSPEELAEILQGASAVGRPVVPWGAGSHQHLGAPPPAGALTLRTTGLDRVVEYAPADLTVTVESGVTLAALQALLGSEGQWLPWDPPGGGRATVGGLLAAGVAGPLRLGYGAPRDRVLGMRVALGDGRLVKSGGRVVKNVAGYDSHKLHIGALGTLGVVAEVTFKLAPLPERTATAAFACPSADAALALAERLRERPLGPVSLAVWRRGAQYAGTKAGDTSAAAAIDAAPAVALARFAGAGAAVERQLRVAAERAALPGVEPLDVADEAGLWRAVAESPSPADPRDTIIVRAGARPSAIRALAESLTRHAGARSALLLPGVGLAYARLAPAGAAEALAVVREALTPHGGYAVVEDAPEHLRRTLDLWGPPPETLALMRGLKREWDPAGILNPGRYVGGI